MSGLFRRGADTRLRKDRAGASPVAVGALVIVLIVIGTYFGFSKHVPFTHGYRLKAVFASATSIRKNSPVRIAGVNIGKVKAIERQSGTDAAVITMEIDKAGLPIHKDATAKIRPRIFLEGNFFVELQPGTPSAPTLSSDDTLPITQTSEPVQLDQVLTALQSDTRQDLQDALQGYGSALTYKPTAIDDRGQDPAVRGETAAKSLNDATRTAPSAFKNTAIVNDAFLGTEPHDLSGAIKGLGRTARALDVNERQLQDLVVNFDRTMATFAGEAANLRATIALLPGTIHNANRALTSLNDAFPATRAFAREILPGVRETPATIDASFPWIAQTRRLLSQAELRGLVQDLRPTTNNLAAVTDQTIALLPQVDLVAQCATNVILPTGDIKISDGALSTGKENYKEFWYTMVGLAGESQNFDGNGEYVRFQPGGGSQTFSTGVVPAIGDRLYGNAPAKPLGTRPEFPGKRPPYHPEAPCKDQKIPDLNAARTGPADGAGNPVPGGGSQAPAAAATGAVTGALGQLPTGGPATRAAKGRARTRSASVAAQLLSRLNPFRAAGARKGAGR
jgi:phospholipid/cholesterol/gamma-HCH transport system substrate-binding protein